MSSRRPARVGTPTAGPARPGGAALKQVLSLGTQLEMPTLSRSRVVTGAPSSGYVDKCRWDDDDSDIDFDAYDSIHDSIHNEFYSGTGACAEDRVFHRLDRLDIGGAEDRVFERFDGFDTGDYAHGYEDDFSDQDDYDDDFERGFGSNTVPIGAPDVTSGIDTGCGGDVKRSKYTENGESYVMEEHKCGTVKHYKLTLGEKQLVMVKHPDGSVEHYTDAKDHEQPVPQAEAAAPKGGCGGKNNPPAAPSCGCGAPADEEYDRLVSQFLTLDKKIDIAESALESVLNFDDDIGAAVEDNLDSVACSQKLLPAGSETTGSCAGTSGTMLDSVMSDIDMVNTGADPFKELKNNIDDLEKGIKDLTDAMTTKIKMWISRPEMKPSDKLSGKNRTIFDKTKVLVKTAQNNIGEMHNRFNKRIDKLTARIRKIQTDVTYITNDFDKSFYKRSEKINNLLAKMLDLADDGATTKTTRNRALENIQRDQLSKVVETRLNALEDLAEEAGAGD